MKQNKGLQGKPLFVHLQISTVVIHLCLLEKSVCVWNERKNALLFASHVGKRSV